jgi:hypothetical protein
MFGACKKKDATPKQQIKLISKVTAVGGLNGDQTTVTSFSYDSKNRLIQRGDYYYTYSGDDLVSISYGQGANASIVYTFTYNNGVPVSMHIKQDLLTKVIPTRL